MTSALLAAQASRLVAKRCCNVAKAGICFIGLKSNTRSFSGVGHSDAEDHLGEALGHEWKEHAYLAVADTTLEIIAEGLSDRVYDDSATLPDADVELSQGVLTLTLGDSEGTYVMNTQTPNRQIWFSSPSSGPGRYGWHPRVRLWCSTRNRRSLTDVLIDELEPTLGDLKFDFSRLDEILDSDSESTET